MFQAFDLEANTGAHYDSRLDRIEHMLGQLMSRGVTSERSTVSEEPRMSMATLTNDSPAVYSKTKLPSPVTRGAEPLRETTSVPSRYADHDFGNVHSDVGAPVVIADPVDFHSLAGHISPDQQNRRL